MRYKLINPSRGSLIKNVRFNRNITDRYLNTTDEDINSPLLFGEDKLREAASEILNAIAAQSKVMIIVDADCDGYTSSALLLNYLNDIDANWTQNYVDKFIHSGKQHGLNDFPIEKINDYKLFFIPDAGSNDFEYHKLLADNGIKVIILDHHEAEKVSENAIIINNQLSDYPNKQLSGVGVTWQFCRYLDSINNTNYANKYLDLVALGNMADMMSLQSLETKHLILKGFKEENLHNPFIYQMSVKNAFSLGDHITPMGAAFYIAPFVNSMVRSGTQEEKELLFNSMLTFKAFEKIPSTKRGHKPGEVERVVDQAVRVATNVKNRQTKAQDAGLEKLEAKIESDNLLDNKVLLFLLKPGEIDRNIAGLIANKFMSKYQRPCCILTKVVDPATGIESYQGSARGYDKGGIDNFKDICDVCASTDYAVGHQGAFGLSILTADNGVDTFIDYTNDILKDMDSEPMYAVDYIYTSNDPANASDIIEVAYLEDLWGKDMDEPLVAFEQIDLKNAKVTLMSPDKNPTLKISLDGVDLIKFRSSQEEYTRFLNEPVVNVIGKCAKNEWMGRISAQIKIEDYEFPTNKPAWHNLF